MRAPRPMLRPGVRLALCAIVGLGSAVCSTALAASPEPPALPASLPAPGPVVVLRAPGPERVLIRAGSFVMGSNELDVSSALAQCKAEPRGEACTEEAFSVEYPRHAVSLSDYWIDRTEVTVARYARCVSAGVCAAPPYADGAERFNRADYPVTLVTWYDAAAFCSWAGGRLPTEAEWERAARGAQSRAYPWGSVYNPYLANHGVLASDPLDDIDGFLELAPVGSFRDGSTPDGLVDLAGNVEEWVGDYYDPEYPQASAENPKGPASGQERVIRGGAYVHGPSRIRSAARDKDLPSTRKTWRGFRCAYPAG